MFKVFELNIIKGALNNINNINYIIMEEPKKEINTEYLPKNIHSKYIDAPSHIEIKQIMDKYNFYRIREIRRE
jgi:hypothetical protein